MFSKTIRLVLFVILGSFSIQNSIIIAQKLTPSKNNKISYYKDISLDGVPLKLPVYKKILDLEINKTKDDLVKLPDTPIFNDNWNTAIFNTYKSSASTFPIDIHFDENTFSAPINRKMVITSRYGWRHGRAHKGIDIDLQIGDSVKSILPGKVRYVKYHSGHGKTVVIRHFNGLETVYAHLSEFLVKENEIVTKGQVIGKGGVTGNARGSHLHLEVRYKGKCIHPEYLFAFDDTIKIRAEDIVITKEWCSPRAHRSNKKSNIQVYKPYKMVTNTVSSEDIEDTADSQQKINP